MLRNAFVDLVMKRLANSQDTTLRDDIINEMVRVQRDVLEGDVFFPWFLVSELTEGATTVGDERVALPCDFIMPWEYGFLYRYDSTLDDPYVELTREDWGLIKQKLNYADTPTHFDFAGNYILLRPVADEIYPLRMRYIARGADLSGTYDDTANNVTNVWLTNAATWFLAEVLAVIASDYLSRKESIVKGYQTQASVARSKLMLKNIAMEEALKTQLKGG